MSESMRDTVGLEFNRAVLEAHALRRFLVRLSAVNTAAAARALVADTPPPGSPSRPLHDRLGELLGTGRVPVDAGEDELAGYQELTARLAAGQSATRPTTAAPR